MKTITIALIVAGIIISLTLFIIWQYSVEITFNHILFLVGMVLLSGVLYWYFEIYKKAKFGNDKTRIAILFCKEWWYDIFGENIHLANGQLKTTTFSDYSEELFKSFIFQVSSGIRKGRFIKLTFSFKDHDIFELNDSPSVNELINPLEDVKPKQISSQEVWALEAAKQRPQRSMPSYGIPVLPVKQDDGSETSFEEARKKELDAKKRISGQGY
jgi:hypothetical protein